MTKPRPVQLAACVRRAWPWLPASLPAYAVVVGPAGPVLRVLDDGTAELVLPGGYPRAGRASDPCAARKGRPSREGQAIGRAAP